jgi:hypothetical protein
MFERTTTRAPNRAGTSGTTCSWRRKPALRLAVLVGVSLAITQALANEAHDLLMRMSEEERRDALAAAVRSVGRPCIAGTETFFQGFGPSEEAFWNVRCREGAAYSVAIYADAGASFSVLECGVLALKARVECFRQLDAQP